MNDMSIRAKMAVLQKLKEDAMNDMGKGMQDGMQKVTVAAPDQQHLQEGLDKAKSLLHQMPQDEEEAGEDPHEEAMETPHEEAAEENQEGDYDEECKTPEEVDAKIADLLKLKHQMLQSHK